MPLNPNHPISMPHLLITWSMMALHVDLFTDSEFIYFVLW